MKYEKVSTRTLNFNYILSKKGFLFFPKEETRYRPVIFFIDNKTIGLSIAKKDEFVKGKECIFDVLYQEHVLKMHCIVSDYDDGILYLNLPRKIDKIQQRGHLRVGCELKCSLEHLATGKIKNISAGGVFIVLDSQRDEIVFDKNSFKLCFTINNHDLRLSCKVIEFAFSFVRAEFINLDEEMQEFLTQYCCDIDSSTYRGALDDR